jgi:hypothetical protein
MLKWFCLSRTRHMKLCSEDSCNYPCCNLRRKVSDMFRDLKNNVNLAKDLWFPDSNRLSIALRRYRNHMKHLHSWRFMTFFNNIWLCLPLSHICKCCATALEGRYYWHGHGEGGFSWLVQRNGLSSCRGQEKLDAFIKALDQFASSWGHCESLAPFSEPWTLSGLRSIFRGKKRASLIYADFCFFFWDFSDSSCNCTSIVIFVHFTNPWPGLVYWRPSGRKSWSDTVPMQHLDGKRVTSQTSKKVDWCRPSVTKCDKV